MNSRALLPWVLGAAAAAAAVTLAIRHGEGTLDSTAPPLPPGPAIGPAPAPVRRGLRLPAFPGDFPAAAADAIRAAWPDIETGPPGKAAAALASLTPGAADSPLRDCAPAALEALAPALEVLITGPPEVAVAAMKCATALARAGGAEGRAALGRSRLLDRAFAQNAIAGSPALQVETAVLLGFAGGDRAQELLVLLLSGGKATEVRVAAAAGLAEAFLLDHRLRPQAIQGVLAAAGEGEPAVLRRACIQAMDRAWEAFRPYDPGPLVASALRQGDRGLQISAATFFWKHPLTAQGPDLVAAVPDAGGEVLAVLADALSLLRPEGWKEALEKRLPGIEDPSTLKSLKRALGK